MSENQSSKTICPLPWLHFSSHLDSTMRICCNTDHMGFVYDNNGKTIKLKEVENLDEYFNLNFYKDIRSQMLKGEKPTVCKKCFQVEEAGGISVRQGYLYKFEKDKKFQEQLSHTTTEGNISTMVRSLDFSLSNNCNLKCIMCSPDASYLIKRDFEKLGIDFDKNFTEGAHKNWKETKFFKKLIPQISENLDVFLTTGGEPFISKPHQQALELMVESGHSENITLQYHTNCTVKNKQLFEIWNQFKAINVHFSIDAINDLGEYIRFGTKFHEVENNVDLMLNHPKVNSEIHSCIQVLNIFNLVDLYKWMKQFQGRMPTLPFHIWMHNPSWLHINILPLKLKLKALQKLERYFADNKDFYQNDRDKQYQILSYLNRSIAEKQDLEGLEVFKKRIREFERLRNLRPIETIIPELGRLF